MKTKKIIMVELVETNVFGRWHCTVVRNLQGGPNPPGFPTTGRDVAYTMPNSRLSSATSAVSMVRIVSIACVRRLACRSMAARIFSTSCPAASTSLASVSKSAFTESAFLSLEEASTTQRARHREWLLVAGRWSSLCASA